MNRQCPMRGLIALLITLTGLPLASSQPVGEGQQASAEATAASAEIAFRRQPVAWAELAGTDRVGDLVGDHLVESARFDG